MILCYLSYLSQFVRTDDRIALLVNSVPTLSTVPRTRVPPVILLTLSVEPHI